MFGNEAITREILGNIPGWLVTLFYTFAFASIALAAYGFFRRFQTHRRGRKVESSSGSFSRRRLFAAILFQEKIRRDRFAGIAHLLTFYGFVILFWGTTLVFLEHDTPLHFFYGWFYQAASLIVDLGGVAFVVGLGMFAWRRYSGSQQAILKAWWVAALLWLLLAIGVTGFLLEGARIAQNFPGFERWSVVGYTVANCWRAIGVSGESAITVHRWLWGTHAVLCVAFFALLPWKFFGHMLYGALSLARKSGRPISKLRDVIAANSPALSTWQELPTSDLLQADACTTCGRCVSVCPANAAGKPLQPRSVVLAVRNAMDAGPDASPMTWLSDDTLWSCTTCGACDEVCPVGIDIYHKIVDLRRARVEEGVVPEPAERVFESVAVTQNPFGRADSERTNWTQGLDVPVVEADEPVDLLYWIGCAGSFDSEGQGVSRSMVKILKSLGIKYKVLGCGERCTGDPARRLGEEGLFQEQVAANVETLRKHRVRKILTHCPHCLNSFKNDYPRANGDSLEVIHHTQFLAEQMAAGRLSVAQKNSERVTFHDPCYLGRGNGIINAPRQALAQVVTTTPVEMPRHGAESFCCGAGGGTMWVDVPGQTRVEHLRAQEAAATGATTVVTGCPFCKVMLRTGLDAVTTKPPRVKDLAELVAENL